MWCCSKCVNTLRPWQNGRQFADNIFSCIIFNENVNFDWNFTEICSQGDKPLSEPGTTQFTDAIYATLGLNEFTHLPLDKMVAVPADNNFRCIFLTENDRIWLIFVPRSSIDNTPALVPVMAWRRTGDKPLPEPMWTQFTDAFMMHEGEMS